MNVVKKLFASISEFRFNRSGGATMQSALLFGAVGLALAVLLTPQLKSASDYYAENRALGVDRVITGAIEKKIQRRIVRRSVLDK